jgi:hypothetical protein
MTVAHGQLGRIGRHCAAATLLLALAGCQSMPLAFRKSRETPRTDSAYAVDLNDAARSAGGKPSRWSLSWKKKASPQPAVESFAPAVSEPNRSFAQYASPVRTQPRARLGSPLTHRSQAPAASAGDSIPVSLTSTSAVSPIPRLPERIGADEQPADHWGRQRLDEVLLTSAIAGSPSYLDVNVSEEPLPLEGVGSLLNASAEDPESPLSESPVLVENGETMLGGEYIDGEVLMDPLACGVGPDGRGLWDNFSSRFGATYYDTPLGHGWGALSTLESTWQLFRSNWFMHAALAGEATNDVYPMSYSAGLSRLAKVVGTQVEKPWIFAVAYDGFWVNDFYHTGEAVYADQLRGMVGYAIKPCWDVGVWGAGGLSTDRMTIPNFGAAPFTYRLSAGDRIAGYSAWNLCQTGIYNILSVGWENGPGNFFIESDGYIPLTAGCNFFVGGGYSDGFGGSTDLQFGLEFIWGRTCLARCLAKKHGCCAPTVGKMARDMLPKHSRCKVAIDPCCVRYRGGWANDTYRSAFRILPPSRFYRMMDFDPISQPQANGTPVPPPAGGVVEPPVDDCPPSANPREHVIPRISGRPVRESRLSQWLDQNRPSASMNAAI